MAGPGGKEIGRLTIRVLPDTDGFRRQVEQELKGFEDIQIGLDLVADDFRQEVTRACRAAEVGQKVEVPLVLDRRNFENAIDRVRPADLPVNVDKDRVEQEFDKIKPKPIDITPNVKPLDGRDIVIPASFDKPELDRELDSIERDLKPVEIPLLPRFNAEDREWTPRIDPIDIPVQLNGNDLSKDMQRMRSEALKVLEKANLLIKLDADDDVLRSKITEARKELTKLKDFGEDILMDADVEPVLKKIKQVEQRLEVLNLQKSSPSVDLRKARLEAELQDLLNRLENFEKKDYSAQAGVNVVKGLADLAKLENQLAKLTANREKLRFEVDDARVGNAFDFLNGKVDTFEQKVESAKQSVDRVADSVERVGQNGTKFLEPTGTKFLDMEKSSNLASKAASSFTDQLAQMGNKMQAVQVVSGLAYTMMAKLPVIAFALSVAGAGITVAFGAIATAIAAINPLIGFLGGAIAVVALGADGIKKAFSALKPEFEELKAVANSTFEQGLKPAVENIRTLMPTVKTAVREVATELSTLGVNLSKVFVDLDKAGVLKDVFENIRDAVRNVSPGIDAIVESMFRVMQLQSGFDAITGAINSFGFAFEQSVRRVIADGSLNRAFQGLEDVLGSLTRAFVGLVENGLKAFAGAAPGTAKFIDQLTYFFGRFDWERLGKAAGDVFEGLGEALEKVDDQTIEDITVAFEELGDLFMDPKFQEGLKGFIEGLPGAIKFIEEFTRGLSDLGGAFGAVIGPISEFLTWFEKITTFAIPLKGVVANIDALIQKIKELWGSGATENNTPIEGAGITFDGLKQAWENAKEFFSGIPEFFSNLMTNIGIIWDNLPLIISTSLSSLGSTIQGYLMAIPIIVTEIFEAAKLAVLTKIGELVTGAALGWSNLTSTISGALMAIPIMVGAIFDQAKLTALTKIGELVTNVVTGWNNLTSSTSAILQAIPIMVSTVFESAKTAVVLKISEIVTNVVTGWNNLTSSTGAVLSSIPTIVGAAFDNARTRVATAIATVITTVASGFATVRSNVTSAVANVQSSISNGFNRAREIASSAMRGLVSSVVVAVSNVITTVAGLPGRISSALGNLGTLLVGAGKALISGLLAGIKSAVAGMLSYVGTIAGQIAAKKGPRPYDLRVLKPNGMWLMSGLQAGLIDGMKDVRALVHRFSQEFAGINFAAPSATQWGDAFGLEAVPAAVRAIRSLADDEMNGVIESDGFGGIGDRVADALEGWGVEIDGNGLAKLVNKSNTKKARRR